MNKPLLLILEGPDRSGKGTFLSVCRDIIPTEKLVTLHSSKPPSVITKYVDEDEAPIVLEEWSFNYYMNLADSVKALSQINSVIILDRSYLGEFVYGPMYRKATYDNDDFYNTELEFFRRCGVSLDDAFLLNFSDSPEKLVSRDDGMSHSSDIEAKHKELVLFKGLFDISAIENKIELNWQEREFSEETCEKVITHIALTRLGV